MKKQPAIALYILSPERNVHSKTHKVPYNQVDSYTSWNFLPNDVIYQSRLLRRSFNSASVVSGKRCSTIARLPRINANSWGVISSSRTGSKEICICCLSVNILKCTFKLLLIAD